MDLIWLLIIWAIVGLLGALRKPQRRRTFPQAGPTQRPEPVGRRKQPLPKRQQAEAEDDEPEEEPPSAPPPSDYEPRPARTAPGAHLRLDRKGVLNGIIMKEVLSKPRGLRPWQPWGQRQN